MAGREVEVGAVRHNEALVAAGRPLLRRENDPRGRVMPLAAGRAMPAPARIDARLWPALALAPAQARRQSV
jgi:hypothetical protein